MELKTFFTFAGAKTRSKKYILPILAKTKKWSTYFEPFIGSGAIFLSLQPERAFISDTNKQLINCWLALRDDPDNFIKEVKKLTTTINSVVYGCKKKIGHFKQKQRRELAIAKLRAWFRAEFISYLELQKKQPFNRLNNTRTSVYYLIYQIASFNGLVNWNADGSPVKLGLVNIVMVKRTKNKQNKIKKVTAYRAITIDFENLKNISIYLNKADIKILCFDYRNINEFIDSKSLIYMDPPYVEIKLGSYKKYGDHAFLVDDQRALFETINRWWANKGARIFCSNNESETLRAFFNKTKWRISNYPWHSNVSNKLLTELAIYNW